MDNLDGIEAYGDPRGVESGEDGGGEDQRNRSGQNSHGPMKADRPTEGLLVDHKNENEREGEAEEQTGCVGQQAQ